MDSKVLNEKSIDDVLKELCQVAEGENPITGRLTKETLACD